MRTVLLVGAVLLAASMPVKAADFSFANETIVAAAPGFDWNGVYLGINGGGAWGGVDWKYVRGASNDWDTDGGTFGATLGYNFQTGPWMIGVEGDFDWADIGGSIDCPNPAFSCNSELDWFATLRGRAGWSTGRFLFFGTAGLAVADMRVETILGKKSFGSSNTAAGWTAGLGTEVGFWSRWSAKLEWLYYDLGTNTYTVDNGLKVKASQHGNMVRVGLNRRFN